MKKIFFIFAVFFLLLSTETALAHNPRLVFKQQTPGVVMIKSPDISQAFYGQLTGETDVYSFSLDNAQDFYYGLLVPNVAGAKTDYTARLSGRDIQGKNIWQVLVEANKWPTYHEAFAGDDYLRGPEKTIYLKAGDYKIVVGNPGNNGKYVLVVGRKESWSVGETFNTIKSLPTLKRDFFERSVWTSFNNRIGLLMIVVLVFLTLFLVSVSWYFGRRFWIAFLVGLFVSSALVSIKFYFNSSRDVWLCQSGQWVAQGRPTTPRSDRPCVNLAIEAENSKFAPAPAVAYLVRDYLSKNLSTLSPEAAVLGGQFHLTNLVFRDNQTAVVSYEDGHNAYVAVFKFIINEPEEVSVQSFDLLSIN